MGRHYKSSKPQMIDYGIKFPLDALAMAVKSKDSAISDNYSALDELKLEMLEQKNASKTSAGKGNSIGGTDRETYDKIMSNYDTKIDQVTNNMSKDLMNTGKAMKDIRNLGTDMSANFRSGDLNQLNRNAATAQTFLKENKDKDPMLVNAILNKQLTGFNSINKDGTYNTLELPPTVFDADIQTKTRQYAKDANVYDTPEAREIKTVSSMMNNKDLYSTIKQQFEYGLILDSDGVPVDFSNMEYVEKRQYIENEMKRHAKSAIKNTQKPNTSNKKTDAEKKAEKKYSGIASYNLDGKGIQVKGFGMLVNEYAEDHSITQYDANIAMIAKYEKELPETTNAKDKMRLSGLLFQAMFHKNAADKTSNDDPYNSHKSSANAKQEYYERLQDTRTSGHMESWESMTNGQQAAISKPLANYLTNNKSAWAKLKIQSSNPELNNNSLNELIDSGKVGETEDPKDIAAIKKMKKGLEAIMGIKDVKTENVKDGVKIIFDANGVEKGSYTIGNLNVDNNYVSEKNGKFSITLPLGTKKTDNFKLNPNSVRPLMMMDIDGNGRWAIDVEYNGRSEKIYFSNDKRNGVYSKEWDAYMNGTKTIMLEDGTELSQASNDTYYFAQSQYDMANRILDDNSIPYQLTENMVLEKGLEGDIELIVTEDGKREMYSNNRNDIIAYISAYITEADKDEE